MRRSTEHQRDPEAPGSAEHATVRELRAENRRLREKCNELRSLCNLWMAANLAKEERIDELEAELSGVRREQEGAKSRWPVLHGGVSVTAV